MEGETPEAGAPAGEGGMSKSAMKKAAKEAEKARRKAEKAQSRENAGIEHIAHPLSCVEPTVSLASPIGTRDFYPDDMRVHQWLFAHFREVARQFAFQEYDAPVLEHDELYKRKAGEEITAQMYSFTDQDGYSVTLRPEMTPSLARMVLAMGPKTIMPLKWFSVPQCWRFEAVQRGRKREHYQWNMDIIGENSISAELELLAAIVTFFKRIGITSADVGLKINSRTVLSSVLKLHGVADESFAPVCVIVDKLDKIGADAVVAELEEKQGLAAEAGRQIVATLAIKSFDELKALLGSAADEAVEELGRLFELAKDYGIDDWLTFDASVVRGLAYYTGIVFEGFDKSGVLRAICGGGRYNRLLTLYGAQSEVAAVGFGFGDCVIMELLALKELTPVLPQRTDYVIVPFDASMRGPALRVARIIREGGFSCDMLLEPTKKVKNAFSYADRIGGERVVFVAPDEWQRGCVRVKDLRSGDEDSKQVDVPVDELADKLSAMQLGSSSS